MQVSRFAASLILAVPVAALAQGGRLPDPPPPASASQPVGLEKTDMLPAFVEAYRRSGQPRILFYTDALTQGGQALTEGALIATLGSRLEDLFRDPEVVIIDSGAASVLAGQQREALSRNEEFAAAKMLGEAAKADLVVYVRLIEQNRKGDATPYAGTYLLADLRRGTSLGRFAWDMFPDAGMADFDSYRVSTYARAIARRVAAQYVEAYPAAGALAGMRRFTVRVMGEHEDDDLKAFRDALNTAEGVRPGSVILRGEDVAAAQTMSTLELMYAGDVLDLRSVARRAAVERLGMEADIIDSREGVIDLRLAPLALSPRERMFTGGAETPRNMEARQQLLAAYEKAGRPTIAVMLNRAAVEKEEPLPVTGKSASVNTGGGTSVIVGDRVSVGDGGTTDSFVARVIDRELRDHREQRREQRVLDLRQFEDQMLSRLVRLGLRPRDLAAAQSAMTTPAAPGTASTPEAAPRVSDDRTLAYELGKSAKADIVVSGVGRLSRDPATGEANSLNVTLRAYGVATGDVLGAATVQRSLRQGEGFNQALDETSAEATAKIVAQLADGWMK